ncbi:hypothetical protein [Bradyrhizobium sp. CCBAU 53415]|nr:hypothetical protein [Bradyrhizobium sp. CCBAU 53415]
MPLDAVLVCAVVTSIFVVFAAALAWANIRAPLSQPVTVAEPKRRAF